MGSSLKDVSRNVICNIRFPLLDPEKLTEVERENQKKDYIPVSHTLASYNVNYCYSQYGSNWLVIVLQGLKYSQNQNQGFNTYTVLSN